MVKIEWERFICDRLSAGVAGTRVFFGLFVRISGKLGYSDSWLDRLWPLRSITEDHPQWWNKLISPLQRIRTHLWR